MAAVPFDADFTFGGTALLLTDISYTAGTPARVDITSAGAAVRQYVAGIAEADTVTTTGYEEPGAIGDTGSFASGDFTIPGTYRIESVDTSGALDGVVTYTATFLRTA